MTLNKSITAAAIAAAMAIGMSTTSLACCKSQWERTEPHFNAGTIGQRGRKTTAAGVGGASTTDSRKRSGPKRSGPSSSSSGSHPSLELRDTENDGLYYGGGEAS